MAARDGDLGEVKDFILEDDAWRIRYVVVDTRRLLPGKKVLLAPEWLVDISWIGQRASTDLTRDEVKAAPEYDPSAPVNRDFEEHLYDFHGRPKYWGG